MTVTLSIGGQFTYNLLFSQHKGLSPLYPCQFGAYNIFFYRAEVCESSLGFPFSGLLRIQGASRQFTVTQVGNSLCLVTNR